MTAEDRYEGLGYREMIAWSSRLQREWPLFESIFASVPEQSLLDLGCGPGEHCARFTAEGWTTTGVDFSATQIADALKHHPDLDFVEADLGALEGALDRQYGAAVCIGNVGPSLDDEAFGRMVRQLSRSIVPGGRFLYHQLEFGPILARERRSIGPIFRSDGDSDGDRETAFIRIFCPGDDDRYVSFLPTRLELDPLGDPPVTLERVESIRVRARRRAEVEAELVSNGFSILDVWGSPERDPHDPAAGNDLWVLAER